MSHGGHISAKKVSRIIRMVLYENFTIVLCFFLGYQGSISPTYLRTAFTPVAPKSVRI